MSAFDVIYYNGKYIAKQDFSLDINDRSFQYGDGLFETMHACGKEVQFFDDHMQRLKRGLDLLKIPLDNQYTSSNLRSAIEGLLHRCRLFQGASVKLSVWRNAEGKFITSKSSSNLLITTTFLDKGEYTLETKGLIVGICRSVTKPISPLFSFKSKNSLIYILAGLEVSENKWDDGVIINDKGNLVEATSSNLFLVQKDRIVTPSLKSGCVAGVMRLNVISIAMKIGYEVIEDDTLSGEDLLLSDEVFFTNAVKGIQWVVGYEKKRFVNRVSRKIVTSLNQSVNL